MEIFPFLPDLSVLVAPIERLQGNLYESERQSIRSAVKSRQLEFIAGRTVARMAMNVIGERSVPLPRGPDRVPRWPSQVIGSISHTKKCAGACVAHRPRYKGVGFDLENIGAVTPELAREILTYKEQQVLAAPALDDATVVFACKEAIYKAVYPIVNEFLEFSDVSIHIDGYRFCGECRSNLRSSRWVSDGEGHFDIEDGMVRALFVIT